MILVVGATGLLGSEVCRRLRSAGESVRALVRATSNREKVEALQRDGVATAVADLKDPHSLSGACRGVSAVITTASSTFSRQTGDSIESVDRAGYLNLIDAAAQASVDHFVYTSIPPNLQPDCPLFTAKREVEAMLARSGIPHTILRANYLMEVWLSPALGFDYGNAAATIYGTGEQPLAWISYRDVAAFTVQVLRQPAARNRTVLAGGPENLTPHDVVRIFEQVSHTSYTLKHVPEDALRAQYAAAEDALGKSFAALMLVYAQGCPMDMTETLRMLPLQLTTVRDYAAAAVRPA
jgi:uncharacterized protein YbjT (DUF2867 family)